MYKTLEIVWFPTISHFVAFDFAPFIRQPKLYSANIIVCEYLQMALMVIYLKVRSMFSMLFCAERIEECAKGGGCIFTNMFISFVCDSDSHSEVDVLQRLCVEKLYFLIYFAGSLFLCHRKLHLCMCVYVHNLTSQKSCQIKTHEVQNVCQQRRCALMICAKFQTSSNSSGFHLQLKKRTNQTDI